MQSFNHLVLSLPCSDDRFDELSSVNPTADVEIADATTAQSEIRRNRGGRFIFADNPGSSVAGGETCRMYEIALLFLWRLCVSDTTILGRHVYEV